ncbi:MAG: YceI family protein [Actinomycetota bacterium]
MTILDHTDEQQSLDQPNLDQGADDPTQSAVDQPTPRRWPVTRIVKWAIGLVLGAVALMYAGIFFYATVLNDAPDALDSGDLSAALVEEPVSEPTSGNVAAPADEPAAVASAPGIDGVWTPSDASEFGYRVDEVLSGVNVTAVGRSNQIAGELSIDGTTADIDVTVQVADIRSDNGSRDGQFRGRIMSADEFPTASFVTTQPIDFGELPSAGDQVTVTATGDLTLRGVTRSVTFDVTAEIAATADGDRIGVLGSIPVVFDDFGIPEPSVGSISVEDNGLIEFVLVFER